MKITLLLDNPKSWMMPYAKKLGAACKKRGHSVSIVHDASKVSQGDVAFFLSCEKIVPKKIRDRNTHNLVIHESALPKGKGWSPLTWQILEGKNNIPITLFEAVEKIDAGDIYEAGVLKFKGNELVDELREKQGDASIRLALQFLDSYPPRKRKKQKGRSTFYARRNVADSELDPQKTLTEQFDLLRVVDNERYPAFFSHRGQTYVLKISKK